MGDTEEVTNVAETVAEQPAEVVSKETISEPDAVAETKSADEDKLEVSPPTDNKTESENNGEAEKVSPKENGTAKEENGAENGSTTDEVVEPERDDAAIAEERKRKTDEVESLEEAAAEVSAEKKAKLEEKSEAKQDEGVENSANGEAEVAA